MFRNLAKRQKISKDEIAELLKVNLEVLIDFERRYESILEEVDNDFFSMNSKQVSKIMKQNSAATLDFDVNKLDEITERIMNELLSDVDEYVTIEELNKLPEGVRPQLTGRLMQKDIKANSYVMLIEQYKKWLETREDVYYHMFRQGLDILDLDPITYEIIGTNPNSMGYWFDEVNKAVKETNFFKIPETKIIKVPLPILQLTRLDHGSLNQTTLKIVNDYCMKVFDLDVNKKYFIKTGTYSSKFDFRNALVQGQQEVRELGEYLLFIHHQALQMASSLSKPTIYGVSTTNEWVVREFIEDVEDNPTIYKGMPLHTEYRLFVDFDSQEVLGVTPYWREDVMKRSFSQGKQSPHKKHDYIIYKMHEEKLYERYNRNIDSVTSEVRELMQHINLPGQWSIDIMQNGKDFYIIDMALASQSALNDCIEVDKIKKVKEDWIPELKGGS